MSHTTHAAPAPAETFDEIERELGAGMVPRIFKLLEGNPALLHHLWGQFRTVILRGGVPRAVKEMVGLVVATHTGCDYVRVVHLHSLALQGLSDAAVSALRENVYDSSALSGAARDALRFAVAAVKARSADGAAAVRAGYAGAYSELGAAGVAPGDAVELIVTVAFFEQVCAVANLLALDPAQP